VVREYRICRHAAGHEKPIGREAIGRHARRYDSVQALREELEPAAFESVLDMFRQGRPREPVLLARATKRFEREDGVMEEELVGLECWGSLFAPAP
jgi:hypothetical protein